MAISTTSTITTDAGGMRAAGDGAAGGEAGFAMIVVIWITGLVALMTLSFTASVRQHVHATADAVAIAQLAALADGGVALAAADLVRANLRDGPPAMLGRVHLCRLPGGELLELRIGDEAGKVDLNVAGEDILTALFAGIGHPQSTARALADAVIDFRDSDDAPRANGAERAQYRAAGHAAVPRNAAFESVAELAQVIGVSGADMAKLLPLVTVRSGQEGIDVAAAAPAVLETLARGAASNSLANEFKQRGARLDDLPDAFRVSSGLQAISVRSAVTDPGGAIYVREAVIGLARGRPPTIDPQSTSAAAGVVTSRRPRAITADETKRMPGIKVWEWYRSRSAEKPRLSNGVQGLSAC